MSRRLINAAANGNLDLVELCIDHGEGIIRDCEEGVSEAARNGHTHIVKFFHKEGLVSIDNKNLLYLAAFGGHFDTVKFLINHGVDTKHIKESIHISQEMKTFINDYGVSKNIDLKTYNTDGRTVCYKCGGNLKQVVGFSGNNLNYCPICEG